MQGRQQGTCKLTGQGLDDVGHNGVQSRSWSCLSPRPDDWEKRYAAMAVI